MPRKVRVDQRILELGLADDIEQARRLALSGKVRSGDRVLDKPGHVIPPDTPLSIREKGGHWVSRGGDKLRQALEAFAIDPSDKICLDVGASTGGFSHVLLERGARAVTALDVGYGLLDWSVRNDPRVTVIERTNFRAVSPGFFPQPFALIVMDVSFISLKLVLAPAKVFLEPGGWILALIKPQFEARKEEVGPGGIVTDVAVRTRVIRDLREALAPQGLYLWKVQGILRSDPKKNLEIFSAWKTEPPLTDASELDREISRQAQGS